MNLFFRQGILTVFLLLCFGYSALCQSSPLIRIGLIADIQYGNIDPSGTRFYRNSLQKLEACVADLNSEKVDFTINLGDLTDRNPDDLDPVISLLGGLTKPVYNTTGNHDYVGIKDNDTLYKKLGMPAAYYSFEHADWVFVMLNTNEVASYSAIAGIKKEEELAGMLERIKKDGRNNGQTWNGGIGKQQMKWLTDVLKNARKKK